VVAAIFLAGAALIALRATNTRGEAQEEGGDGGQVAGPGLEPSLETS
jgi:hypothetical protein